MDIQFKDVAHLYLGCEGFLPDDDMEAPNYNCRAKLTYNILAGSFYSLADFKPILRPLSSMTEDELIEAEKLLPSDENIDDEDAIEMFKATGKLNLWLLSKHFDLFGLIENGYAIDATAV